MKRTEKMLSAALTITLGVLLIILKANIISILMTILGVGLIVLGVMDLIHKNTAVGICKLVVGGVIAEQMSLLRHTRNEVGIADDQIFKDEEGTGGAVLFQRVKNTGDVAVFVSRIKGEIDDFFFGILPEKNAAAFGDIRHLAFRRGAGVLRRIGGGRGNLSGGVSSGGAEDRGGAAAGAGFGAGGIA